MKIPDRVEIDLRTRTVLLEWPGGTRQRITHRALRLACPCVECRRARLRDAAPPTDDGIAVSALNSVGYGVQVVFTDGHDRGIYPWSFLETIG